MPPASAAVHTRRIARRGVSSALENQPPARRQRDRVESCGIDIRQPALRHSPPAPQDHPSQKRKMRCPESLRALPSYQVPPARVAERRLERYLFITVDYGIVGRVVVRLTYLIAPAGI